ncbi:ABC transporter ATP-binding protein [Propylenella binzhouense]|uniref:ABC transporter ATP-binding protein n=1 Tax=Propylenella binzhouense TaxID=2555902 RepID=A0A964T3K9_9HYPH|nr:ABC transporter ATP-binding protein [Propylenella binzhouense]MYZ47679.1 ABC transporter ATP-binding protein [Propylenella binzhouense]
MLSSPRSATDLTSGEAARAAAGLRLVAPDAAGPVIELRGLTRVFRKPLDFAARAANLLGADIREEVVRAVDGVDLSVQPGEVVGLAGESGCGKSTLGRMVAGILSPSAGDIYFEGRRVAELKGQARRDYALAVQMIFQDPYTSLNPRMRIRDIVGEAPLVHGLTSRAELKAYVREMLSRVRMDPQYDTRYPHQFSGGQRQRIGIARALAVKPKFIVCDEAVAALDVSIQAQILNLFMELREQLSLTYLFISHDLGVINHLADRVVIMYLGRVVEEAETDELFARPNHPYTTALLDEIPRIETRRRVYQGIKGEIPSPLNPPSGCYFHPRCPHAMPVCREVAPPLKTVAPGHRSACHLNDRPA